VKLTDIHPAVVGHTGKDVTRGQRGSNASVGHGDLMVEISGDLVRTATVKKANDAPEGPLFSFKSEIHEFGTDEDGDPIAVNIVSDEQIATSESKPAPNRKLSARQQLALDALSEATISHGKPAPLDLELHNNIRVVTDETWKNELFRRGVLSQDDANPRQEFKRLG
jgi:hypothetical protein